MTAQPLRAFLGHKPLMAIEAAHIAFQPIVAMGSLRTHGFEALARLDQESGFATIHDVMDAASTSGQLLAAEQLLLTKSITRFSNFPGASATRLFCNLDNRVFDDPSADPGRIVAIARHVGLEPANLCLELSERQPPRSMEALRTIVDKFLQFNVRIAIDDFGKGFSGLDTLLQVNPHYIKIDRAFIADLDCSPRKQAIVGKITGLAHSLGLLVVAEGVETQNEFRTARDLGCDLAQGFLVAHPTQHLRDLRMRYEDKCSIESIGVQVPPAIALLMERVEPLRLADSLRDATERFKTRSARGMLPVVDEHDYVHGAIYESDIGNYLFGDYGTALLANKGLDQSVNRVLRRCPISEATVAPQALVESYVVSAGNEGVVLTVQGRYVGLMGNNAMLRLAAAGEVAAARDQNPLTSLPGNRSINRHLEELLSTSTDRILAFFDFDNFKAFNDKYGFSAGDQAIAMFAEFLLALCRDHDAFVGHIGGDDFFLSIAADQCPSSVPIELLCSEFRRKVTALYSEDDILAGGITSDDRFGHQRFFPLLRTSAVLLHLPSAKHGYSTSGIVSALASGKTAAKMSQSGIIFIDPEAPIRLAPLAEVFASAQKGPAHLDVDRLRIVGEDDGFQPRTEPI